MTDGCVNVEINIEGEDSEKRLAKRRRQAVERLSGGLVATAGWSAAFFLVFHARWMLFPLLFMGVLPVIKGLRELVALRLEAPSRPRRPGRPDKAEIERGILRLARERRGRVSPALVAIETGLGLEEAQAALDGMAARGHASLVVLESGRIEYEFSEFLPSAD